jgi:hypothetical protein
MFSVYPEFLTDLTPHSRGGRRKIAPEGLVMGRILTLERLRRGEVVLKTASLEARHGAFWTWADSGHLAAASVCRRLERLGLLKSADALIPGEGGQTYTYAPRDPVA